MSSSNNMMRAVVFDKYGSADVLKLQRVQKPTAAPGQVVIRNKAVAVNPIDYKVRAGGLEPGKAAPDSRKIVGWDAAGVVTEVGAGVRGKVLVGDRVWYAGDLTKDGTYAEYTVIDNRLVGKMPRTLTFDDAAALPLTWQTAYEILVEQMGAKRPGEAGSEQNRFKTVLVFNGAGGLGSAAIKVAKWLNLTVVATASRPESEEWAKKMGADFVINHRTNDLMKEAKTQLGENFPGFDYLLNAHENDRFHELVKILSVDGKIGLTWKTTAEDWAKVDMDDIWFARKTVVYGLMFARALAGHQTEKVGQLMTELAALVDAGKVSTTVSTRYEDFFKSIGEAHKLQESGKVCGKIVLSLPEEMSKPMEVEE